VVGGRRRAAAYPGAVEIRAAREEDLPAVAAIYAHYVEHTAITFDLEAPTVDAWRDRLRLAGEAGHPWFVACSADDAVVAYATTSAFRPKPAYRSTVETTIYVQPEHVGHGVGRPLYDALLREAASRSFHRAVAGMTLPNAGSLALHEAVGFSRVGVFEQVGHKLGRWHDVAWFQRPLTRH
jgi:phosphinothricin acetyltransferase